MGCWLTRPGLGACFCAECIRRSQLSGLGEVLTPLALGRKMKPGLSWKPAPSLFMFFWMRSSCSDFLQLFVKSDSVMGMTSFVLHNLSSPEIPIMLGGIWKWFTAPALSSLLPLFLFLSPSPFPCFPPSLPSPLFASFSPSTFSLRKDTSPTACLKTIWKREWEYFKNNSWCSHHGPSPGVWSKHWPCSVKFGSDWDVLTPHQRGEFGTWITSH